MQFWWETVLSEWFEVYFQENINPPAQWRGNWSPESTYENQLPSCCHVGSREASLITWLKTIYRKTKSYLVTCRRGRFDTFVTAEEWIYSGNTTTLNVSLLLEEETKEEEQDRAASCVLPVSAWNLQIARNCSRQSHESSRLSSFVHVPLDSYIQVSTLSLFRLLLPIRLSTLSGDQYWSKSNDAWYAAVGISLISSHSDVENY